jgi:hypothetical protein
MPNTITHSILRERYTARFGHPPTIKSHDLQILWMSTANGRNRGRNVSRTELDSRTAKTLDLIHKYEAHT